MKLIRSLSMRSNSGLLVADGPTSRATTPATTKREKRPPMDLMSVSLEELARVVAEDADAPDVSHVMRYGQMVLENGLGSKQKQKNPRLIYHGSLLMDWAAQHGYPLSTGLQRMLGYAHSETWLSGGVHSEAYSLTRAKELYEAVLLNLEQAADPSVWLEYSQVLLFQGNYDLGARTTALIATKFADTPSAPVYLLNAAAMFFAAGNFDQAGKHMFQSIQTGPPKFFSKSEMLFMLSRTFEQSGTLDDSRAEDGYFMVYQNLDTEEMEGSPSYEQWLNRTATWTAVADKCVMYGLYSLAADLYGQALVRDPAAFRNSKIWFRYSKSSYRCGKSSDAQLSVKQAIALDPDNVTCRKTLEAWSSNSEEIKALVEGPLIAVLTVINGSPPPRPKSVEADRDSPEKVAARLQAFYCGEVNRLTEEGAPLAARAEVAEGRIVRAGIVARVPVDGGHRHLQHQMLLAARLHYASESVRVVKIFDMKTAREVVIKLKSPFIVPHVEYRETDGAADDVSVDGNHLEVQLSHDNVPSASYNRLSAPLTGEQLNSAAGGGERAASVAEQQLLESLKRIEQFDFSIRCEHVSSRRLEAGSRAASPESLGGTVKDVILVHLRFLHRKSGKFTLRQISLNFDDAGGLAVGEAKKDIFGDVKVRSRAGSPEYDKIPRTITATPPSRGAAPPQERHHTPSMLSPVREDRAPQVGSPPDRLADEIGQSSSLHSTPLVRPVPQGGLVDDSKSQITDSQGDFLSVSEVESHNDEASYMSEYSSGSGYSSSSSYTYTTGSYSYDDSMSRSMDTEDGHEAPNPRGTFKFFDMLYMFRAYHPGEEAALGVSFEMGTRLLEGGRAPQPKAVMSGLKTMSQSMAIHVLQVPTNRMFIFVLPPEEMPHRRLIHQMVFFLLSVAREVSESAHVFDSELNTAELPTDTGNVDQWGDSLEAGAKGGDISESKTWNISGQPSQRTTPVPASASTRASTAASRRAQTVRKRAMRGVNVLGRHMLVSAHSPHPGVVRIYVVDPLMRSIIPPSMRSRHADDDITEYSRDSKSIDASRASGRSKNSRNVISDWNDGGELTDDEADHIPPSPSMAYTKSNSNRGSWQRSQSSSLDDRESPALDIPLQQPSNDPSALTGSYDDSMSTASSYIYQDDQSSYDSSYSSSSYTTNSASLSQSVSQSETLGSGTSYTDSYTATSATSSYSSYSESGTSFTPSQSTSQTSGYPSKSEITDERSAVKSVSSSVLSPSVDTKQSTGRAGPGSLLHSGYHEPAGVDGEPSELTFIEDNGSLEDSSIISEPSNDVDTADTSILRTNSNSLSGKSLVNEVIPEGDEEESSRNLMETETDESNQIAPGVFRVVYGDSDSSTGMTGTVTASASGSKLRGSLVSVTEESVLDDETSVASSVSYFSHEVQTDDDSSSKFVNIDSAASDDESLDNSQWTRSSTQSRTTSAVPEPSSSLREGSQSTYDSSTLHDNSQDSYSYVEGSSTVGSSYVTGSTSYVTCEDSQTTDMSSSYLGESQSSYTGPSGTTDPSGSTHTDMSSSYTDTDTDTRGRDSSTDFTSTIIPSSTDQDSLGVIEEAPEGKEATEEVMEPQPDQTEEPVAEAKAEEPIIPLIIDEMVAPVPIPVNSVDESVGLESSTTFSLTLIPDDDDNSTIRTMDGPETRRNSVAGPENSVYSAADSTFGEASQYSDASAFFPDSSYDGSVSVILEDSETDYSTALSLFPEGSKVLSQASVPPELFIEDTTYSQVDGYDYDSDVHLEESSVGSLGGSISEFPRQSRFSWRDAKLAGDVVDAAVHDAIAATDAIPRPPPRPPVEISHKRTTKAQSSTFGYTVDDDPIAPEESQLSVGGGSAFSGYEDGDQSFDFGAAAEREDSLELGGAGMRRGSSGGLGGMYDNGGSFSEGDNPRSRAAKAQAMNFLAWQKKRLEAIDYISERVSNAVRVVTKRDAFTYLKRRVAQAQEKLKKKPEAEDGAPVTSTPATGANSEDEASVDSAGSRRSKRSRRGRSRLAGSRGSNAVRFTDDVSPLASPDTSPTRPAPKKPPLRRASTLSSSLMPQKSLGSPFAGLRPKDTDDTKTASDRESMKRLEEARLKAEAERRAKAYEEEKERLLREEEERLSKLSPTDALNDPSVLLKVLTRRQQCMPLSWIGQLESAESGKKTVQWEDGLSSGQVGGGPAKGKPQRLHHKTKHGKRIKMHNKSPVDFLDDPADDSAVVFDKSISDYGRVGYSAGSCEYLQVWNAKIKKALGKFRTVAQLNRAVEMLRRNTGKEFSNELSRAEALVGLGEANGSPAEALGVLRDVLFREEALNVCRSMPLKEVARVLEDACKHGIAAFGDEFNQSAMFTESGRRIGMDTNEALERARNKKAKNAELCDKFKEVVHKILDSGLSSEVINHIAQLQGEQDPSASFFASSSFVAPAPEPAEPVSNMWRRKTASEILSPGVSPSQYDTGTGDSALFPDIYASQQLQEQHQQLSRTHSTSTASSNASSRRASKMNDGESDDASGSTHSTRYRKEVTAMSQSLNLQRQLDQSVGSPHASVQWANNTTGMAELKLSQSMKKSQSSQPPGAIRVGRTIEMMMKRPGSSGSPPREQGRDSVVSSRDLYKMRQKQLLSLSPSFGVFKKQQEASRAKFKN